MASKLFAVFSARLNALCTLVLFIVLINCCNILRVCCGTEMFFDRCELWEYNYMSVNCFFLDYYTTKNIYLQEMLKCH